MDNKITFMILFTILFVGIVQAQVFSTPGAVQECPVCPEQITCDNSTQIQTQEITPKDVTLYYVGALVLLIFGFILGMFIKNIKNPFSKGVRKKKKKDSILDLDDPNTRDRLFEEASQEEVPEDTQPTKLYNELSPKEREKLERDSSKWTKFRY